MTDLGLSPFSCPSCKPASFPCSQPSCQPSCRAVDDIVLDAEVVAITVVGLLLGLVQGEVLQVFADRIQSRGGGVLLDFAVLEVLDPFLQRGHGDLVELVDADQVVFGKDVSGQVGQDSVLVADGNLQVVVGVDPDEVGASVVEVFLALTEVEVEDADGVDLLDVVVALLASDVLGDGLGDAVEDAFEVVALAVVLDFDEDDLVLAVAGLDVDAVGLVVLVVAVAFAFEDFEDADGFVQQDGEEAFEDGEIGLLAQEAFDGPVEADVAVGFRGHGSGF